MAAFKQVLLDILDSREDGDDMPVFSFPDRIEPPSRKELMEEENA